MVYTSLYCIPRHTKLEYPIETDKSQEPCKITHKIKNLLYPKRERGVGISLWSLGDHLLIFLMGGCRRSSPCWKSCAAAAALDKRNPYPRHTSTTRDHHQLKCDTWRGHKNGDEIADGLIDRLSGESSYMVNSGRRRRRCELTREVITVEYMLLLLPPKSSAHSFKLGQSVAIQSRNINRSQRVTIVRPNLQLDWIRDDDDGKNKRTIILYWPAEVDR